MLYKYCNPKGIDILLNRRLKASKIQDLNDPFELVFGIDGETSFQKLTEEYKANPKIIRFWKKVLRSEEISFNQNNVMGIIEKFADFQTSDLNRVAREIHQDFQASMGIVCLTEQPAVIQMWAHYTENHTGIVVGVDEALFVKNPEALVKVQYREDMILLPVTGDARKFSGYKAHFLGLLGRKEKLWAYENEVRLYLRFKNKNEDGNYYSAIPPEAIREVYLGINSSDTLLQEVKDLSLNSDMNHLKIFKMTKHKTKYKLNPLAIE